jgi:hypothetical protein
VDDPVLLHDLAAEQGTKRKIKTRMIPGGTCGAVEASCRNDGYLEPLSGF